MLNFKSLEMLSIPETCESTVDFSFKLFDDEAKKEDEEKLKQKIEEYELFLEEDIAYGWELNFENEKGATIKITINYPASNWPSDWLERGDLLKIHTLNFMRYYADLIPL